MFCLKSVENGSELIIYINPLPALVTSHDNHGEGVSHQAQRHCKTSCSHSECSGMFRKSQVLENEHFW